ncbi:MAG: pantetheine-phosphate adenylyltransferase [Epsilonproteobacteria bacterium]|nr:pantetheine-phosphate adenylyltransferase [Campylobacterota bacterium]
MKKIALYPGTFDPITNGHLDIINRANAMFDGVIVAIAESHEKKPMFDLKTRAEMVKRATNGFKDIEVVTFDTLLVDLATKCNTNIIIRGLRAVSDFEYELQMSYANSSISPELETVFLMPSLHNAFISSSIVRAILKYNGDASHLVSKEILPFLEKDANVLNT